MLYKSFSVGLAAMLLAACGADNVGAPQGADAPPFPVAAPLVEHLADWRVYSGRFEAPQAVDVRARVGGYLDSVHFQDGQMVERGDLLFTIDPRPYEAAAESARGELARADAQAAQAARALDRATALLGADAISREELETAQTAQEQAEAARTAARATLRERELDLEFTRITAPISGRVSDRRVDPGNLVAPGGEVLTTLVAADPIHFAFEASESALLNLRRQGDGLQGAPARIRLQGEGDYAWSGAVVFIDNAIDPLTGTLRLRVEVENPDGVLRPGMFGEAMVQGGAPYEAVLVPETAILADATRRLVYVVNDDNQVEARSVAPGPRSGALRVVAEGLAPGERIVISGLLNVQAGMTIDPQDQVLTREAVVPPVENGGYGAALADAALPVD